MSWLAHLLLAGNNTVAEVCPVTYRVQSSRLSSPVPAATAVGSGWVAVHEELLREYGPSFQKAVSMMSAKHPFQLFAMNGLQESVLDN